MIYYRALVHLESGGDPAWEALNSRSSYLNHCLDKCCEEHLASEAGIYLLILLINPVYV